MAGTASFFQTWPREGRRLRHLRCPGPPLPRSARARPRPPEPGHPRGLPATTTTPRPSEAKAPSSPPGPCPPGPASPARPGWESHVRPRAPAPSSAGPGRAKPGLARSGPRLGWPRGGWAGRVPPGRAPREAANMAPSVTQPLLPPAPPATRTRAPPGRTPADEALKVCFPPPHRPPLTAAGARGRQRVNPRALAPPSAPVRPPARPPSPSEPASCALPRAEAGEPAAGAPQVATMTCKSSEGEGARRGLCLQRPGSGSSAPGGSSSSCPCFPLPPSSNLTFRGGGGGGRGVPACAARAVGRGRLSAEAGGAGLGGGRRAGRRAEPPEPSYSRERRETMEGKGGWSAARVSLPPPPAAGRTALKPATRRRRLLRSLTRPRAAPLARLGGRGCSKDGAGRRGGRAGRGWGPGAARGTRATSSPPSGCTWGG